MDKVSSLSIALHIRIIVKELLNEVRKLYLINTNLINQKINIYIRRDKLSSLTIYVRVVVEELFNEVRKGEVGEDLQEVGGIWLRDSDHPDKIDTVY